MSSEQKATEKKAKQTKQTHEHAQRMWAFNRLKVLPSYYTDSGLIWVALPGRNGIPNHVSTNSDAVQRWLLLRYTEDFPDDSVSLYPMKDALMRFEGHVLENGERREPNIRVAPGSKGDGTIWLDLGHKAVHLMPGRWEMVDGDKLPDDILFRRPPGYLPIEPEPQPGGNLRDLLRPFIHCGDGPDGEQRWQIVVGWLLGTFLPWGDYAILVLNGDPNSGKSTTSRYLRDIVDPAAGALNRFNGKEQELVVQATNTWVTAYDNISHISPAMSDLLCQISTGLGVTDRKFYTNNEPVIYRAHGPIILNGVKDFVHASDLVTRTLRIHLPSCERKGVSRSALDATFTAARPRILGALLDVAAAGLARLPEVMAQATELPRLGDLRNFVTACEPALGWEPGTWDRITAQAEVTAHSKALESSTVLDALLSFLVQRPQHRWEGKTSDLHRELKTWAKEKGYHVYDKSWPDGPVNLGKLIQHAVLSLNAIGITIEFYRDGPRSARVRCVRLVDTRAKAA